MSVHFNSYSYSCHEYCGICSDIRNERKKKHQQQLQLFFFSLENASIVVARIRPFPFNFIDCSDRMVCLCVLSVLFKHHFGFFSVFKPYGFYSGCHFQFRVNFFLFVLTLTKNLYIGRWCEGISRS